MVEKPEVKSRQVHINLKELQDRFVIDLEKLILETRKDALLHKLIKAVERKDFDNIEVEYYVIRNQLSTRYGLLLNNDRIVIPKSMQFTILQSLHTGHIGYTKMMTEAKCFWWREMEFEIEEKACASHYPQPRQSEGWDSTPRYDVIEICESEWVSASSPTPWTVGGRFGGHSFP